MKRKNHGFTLIELLAVIVILAIIALIAVPVVMNIITKSRKSAFKDSAYGIIKAGELYYADRLLEPEGMTDDKTFDFSNGIEGLEIKGTKPTAGTMTVTKEGKVAIVVTDGKYCITKGYDDADVTITDGVCASDGEDNTEKTLSGLATTDTTLGVESIIECTSSGTVCDVGTAFAIKVNKNETHKFYVINDTGTEVTLIMDRNLGDNVAWYAEAADNSYGPITVLNYLNSQTEYWINIEPITEYIYDNNLNGTTTYGYQKLEITNGIGTLISKNGTKIALEGTSRARMLTSKETAELGHSYSNCPSSLCANLTGSSSPYGYWTLSAYAETLVEVVYKSNEPMPFDTNLANLYGVRPVITLLK